MHLQPPGPFFLLLNHRVFSVIWYQIGQLMSQFLPLSGQETLLIAILHIRLFVSCLHLSCNFYFKACGLIPGRQPPFSTTVIIITSKEDRAKHFLIFRVIPLISEQ